MKEIKIFNDNGNGFYKGFVQNDIEFVDPIKYYSNLNIQTRLSIFKDILFMKDPLITSLFSQKDFYEFAKNKWNEKYEKILSTEVPINFLKLLESERKKEQERLMRGQGINTSQ